MTYQAFLTPFWANPLEQKCRKIEFWRFQNEFWHFQNEFWNFQNEFWHFQANLQFKIEFLPLEIIQCAFYCYFWDMKQFQVKYI